MSLEQNHETLWGWRCDVRFGAGLAGSVGIALLRKGVVLVRQPKRRLAALEELCYQE
jgi:hypothetical protein